MSIKNTLVLALILALLGGYIVFLRVTKTEEKTEDPPDVWSYDEETIEAIQIRLLRKKKAISFTVKGRDSWFIDETAGKTPVDLKRWGGVVLLVSGPQSRRVIARLNPNLDEYGFNNPNMLITLKIKGRPDKVEVVIGDHTPDEKGVYVKIKETDTVYLLDFTWYDVLERLAVEPPRKEVIESILKT
ncbi:MAG: DUF4340 domain-containing protein [Proteobacteria bacterium]|nr:DUF4340 domain-containing protein [Pseudomonadota bacterium]